MKLLNFSLNNLSMMALILSVGFVVDDAIVMLENIVRHIEAGEDRLDGVAQGIEGNRLHDPDDDDVARGGVHPDPVHERHPRPAVPRVRGDDHSGDPDFRPGVDHADADAVQPVPARRAHQEGAGRPARSRLRCRLRRLPVEPRPRAASPLRHGDRLRGRARGQRCTCTASSRRDSFPTRTRTFSSSTCRRRRARRSPDMSLGALRAAEIIKQNPYIDSFNVNLGGRWQLRRRRKLERADPGAAAAARAAPRLGAADRAAAAAAAVAVSQLPRVRQNPARRCRSASDRATAATT